MNPLNLGAAALFASIAAALVHPGCVAAAEPAGKPPAPPTAMNAPQTEKSGSGKPVDAPAASNARRRSSATGPGTQTEDDVYVGLKPRRNPANEGSSARKRAPTGPSAPAPIM